MNGRVETRRFHVDNPDARLFFEAHGYVVVHGVLNDSDRSDINWAWDRVVSDAAHDFEIDARIFVHKFPQNRDLWRKHTTFRRLLFDTRQAPVAQTYLNVAGVRLLHDHAIVKPTTGSSTIPWHQDSAYWPVDRAGLSLWTPTTDVSTVGGCLMVLAGSHLDGPAPPRDFLAQESVVWQDEDPRRVQLPVLAGDTVILHGLTWHSSAPNGSATDRLAYLTLWVPSSARFWPEHAQWHPVVGHVTVKPGERLEGDWFPLFGEIPEHEDGQPVRFPVQKSSSGPSMFVASKQIAEHISLLMGCPTDSLGELFSRFGARRIAYAAVAAGVTPMSAEKELEEVLNELILNDAVRKRSVARDVYLGVVLRWWRLAGTQLHNKIGTNDVVH